jgi:hypothetical protein
MPGRWTKWWWLHLDQMETWSATEFQAFGAFVLIWIAKTVLYAWLVLITLHSLEWVNTATSVFFSILLALPASIPGLRGLTTTFFRNAVIKGDDAAANRLGGQVNLPANEFWTRGFWWIDFFPIGGSETQAKARQRMLVITAIIFIPSFVPLAHILMSYGASEHLAALISLIATMPAAFYAARRIAILFWPELIQSGDEAVTKANNSV